MYLMQKVYRTLYPGEQTDYLQVSRRSLAPAFLAAGEFACVQAALPRQLLTGKQLADFCGTVCPPAAAAGQFDVKHPDGAELYEFLRSLPRPEAADTAKAYLQGRRLRPGDILVDIGSGGTTQRVLQELLGTELHGMQRALTGCARRFSGAPEPTVPRHCACSGRAAPVVGTPVSQDVPPWLHENACGLVRNLVAQPAEPLAELQGAALCSENGAFS